MATWIRLMPNDSKPWKKKMLAESMLKNPVLEEVNAKNWASGLPAKCRRYSSLYFFLGLGFDLPLPALRAAAAAFLPAAVYA